MTHINEEKLDAILRSASHKKMRDVLQIISVDSGATYSELLKSYCKKENMKSKSGLFAHYLNVYKKAGIIKRDEQSKIYYLTRIGVHVLQLVNDFQQMCIQYDLSECDDDGKPVIMVKIKGRKMK